MDRLVDSESIKEFRQLLDESERIVLTCHVRPDGDAVGSTLGMKHLLHTLGKEASVVIPDKAPQSLSFLPGFKDMGIYTYHPEFCQKSIEKADLLICCDFNTPSRQDSLAPVVQNAKCRKVLVDHHQEPDHFADIEFSYPEMSSTCELMFRIIAGMGLYTDMNLESATCILTGIVTDTRNFTVNCRHTDLYEILMRLLEKGADKTAIVKEALSTRSYWSLKLEAYALSQKMEIFPSHQAALITLGKDELEKFHYERGDSEGLVNRPLEIRGMTYSVFLREDPDRKSVV